MSTKILNVTEARQNFSNLIRTLNEPIYVTVYGKPRAVMLSYDGYELLLNRLAAQQDSQNQTQRINQAETIFNIGLTNVPDAEALEEEIHLALEE